VKSQINMQINLRPRFCVTRSCSGNFTTSKRGLSF
jgi:hypothetical protein